MKLAARSVLRTVGLLLLTSAPLLAAEAAEEGGHGELPRIVNFTVLAVILALVLRKPLAGYLNARTEQIREQLKEAAEKTSRAEVQRRQAVELLASLDDEVEKARAEAKRAAEAERERILKSAEQEATRIRELSRKEIGAELEAGRRRLLARATELSVELAHKKLETTMTEDDQKRLIDRSIEILGNAP